ncbi:calcium-independent phospholipase A2-gamma-like isoform X2 [Brienomyrus brachyistius]|uniref:calcium-independent phospholipase A2-gamma-like isoform X2 n=1 Tax=Brienomyrus brachyistius TaxID=42636 RepID=UPI0020B1D573|nr:calcium-independent phospholipase A2-gamma-like isoform X2 [Brienomyrus brachyistius]
MEKKTTLHLCSKQIGFLESFYHLSRQTQTDLKVQPVSFRPIFREASFVNGVQRRFQSNLSDKGEATEAEDTASAQPQPYSRLQLFHISSLATRFGESYSYVAQHINLFFSRGPAQEVQAQVSVGEQSDSKSGPRKSNSKGVDSDQVHLKDNGWTLVDSRPLTADTSGTWNEGYLYVARRINSYFGAKVNDTDQESVLNPDVSSSWDEGYLHFAHRINSYFGAKITDATQQAVKQKAAEICSNCSLADNTSWENPPEDYNPRLSNTLLTPKQHDCVIRPKSLGLFHISSIATKFGEGYVQLANHINQYFSSKETVDRKSEEDEIVHGDRSSGEISAVDMPDSAQQKPTPMIDGLLKPVSNMLRRLVGSWHEVSELKAEVFPAKTILTRRVMSRKRAEEETRRLIGLLQQGPRPSSLTGCIEDLNGHLIRHPACRAVVWQEKAVVALLSQRRRLADNQELQCAISETLALIGYTDPVKGRGIRVLSIDGGGTRGIVPLCILEQLEEATGKRVHQLFDYICGVSTGAVVAFLLGLARMPLDECEELYHRFGSEVFRQNALVGTMKMGFTHSYYDTETWERILREKLGDKVLIKTSREKLSTKVSAVSTVVNWGTGPKPFIFRNYNHNPSRISRYAGSSGYQLWQAVRASSAAPGYFQEFPLHNDIHQDGGLILNNPCALAIHECRLLWPDQPFQCVLSLGTGRYDNTRRALATSTSLRAKISNLISSATDTEGVHMLLEDLLSDNVYFRFNPMLSAEVSLDESRPKSLEQLRVDTQLYLERNQHKMERLHCILGAERSALQHTRDWLGQQGWALRQRWSGD